MPDPVYAQLDYLANEITKMEATMINPQEFGQLQGAVVALKNEIDQVRNKQSEIDRKLDLVIERLSEAKGGWRMLMLLGGAGATLGAGITWLLTHTVTVAPK